MRQSKSLMTLTMTATTAVIANRFIGITGTYPAAAGNAYGVSVSAAAIGERFPVTSEGTEVVESGAAIAAGAAVETDATGRAVTKAAGVALARLAPGEVATAAGQFVEVIIINN